MILLRAQVPASSPRANHVTSFHCVPAGSLFCGPAGGAPTSCRTQAPRVDRPAAPLCSRAPQPPFGNFFKTGGAFSRGRAACPARRRAAGGACSQPPAGGELSTLHTVAVLQAGPLPLCCVAFGGLASAGFVPGARRGKRVWRSKRGQRACFCAAWRTRGGCRWMEVCRRQKSRNEKAKADS
ncbi:MAG: hypothetical protein J3K34DRAFT_410210 [Monoraphidium minutum]|nr:MAG: hypothetical protein J3K34DRAFT_410210 [Monoraphidium minutum]